PPSKWLFAKRHTNPTGQSENSKNGICNNSANTQRTGCSKGLRESRHDQRTLGVPGAFLLLGVARHESAVQADCTRGALGHHSTAVYNGDIYDCVWTDRKHLER